MENRTGFDFATCNLNRNSTSLRKFAAWVSIWFVFFFSVCLVDEPSLYFSTALSFGALKVATERFTQKALWDVVTFFLDTSGGLFWNKCLRHNAFNPLLNAEFTEPLQFQILAWTSQSWYDCWKYWLASKPMLKGLSCKALIHFIMKISHILMLVPWKMNHMIIWTWRCSPQWWSRYISCLSNVWKNNSIC